jgi:hypothetical protein
MERFDIKKAHKERKDRVARRDATRSQIRDDQKSDTKRDEEALEREREWFRQNRKP